MATNHMGNAQRIARIISAIPRLETVTDLAALEILVTDITHDAGFDWFACSVIRPTSLARPDLTIISNVPNEWRERYSREGLLTLDPVVATARTQIQPIFWQQVRAHDEQMQVMDAAYSMGLRDGVSFPLRGPNGERGALSFIRDAVGVDDGQRVSLGAVTPYMMDAMIRCSRSADKHELSHTERKCLFWAAAGKTTEEIGIIIDMPARTVTYHIRLAVRKLGATNRDQAVAYAALRGLIRPGLF
jgi:LuxR family transcriptional activator of bioluminescence operon